MLRRRPVNYASREHLATDAADKIPHPSSPQRVPLPRECREAYEPHPRILRSLQLHQARPKDACRRVRSDGTAHRPGRVTGSQTSHVHGA